MKKKIMIVDDDPDQLSTVRIAFKKLFTDYKIITASGGEQCLKLLENNQVPDLILLDIMMPEISGWITYNKIKEKPLWVNIPIVFL